jgi:hypothetical protein
MLALPFPCDGQFGALEGDPGCSVPLGAACASDADCGQGTCLTREGDDFYAGGYCAGGGAAGACVPAGSTFLAYGDAPEDEFYVKHCSSDQQCRTAEGYSCDVLLEACLPRLPIEVSISQPFCVRPICGVEFTDRFERLLRENPRLPVECVEQRVSRRR